MIVKHILGYVLLLTTVVLGVDSDISLVKKFGITAILYFWFLLTTRCDRYIFMLIMLLLLVAYLIKL